jgi:hypothetical protein
MVDLYPPSIGPLGERDNVRSLQDVGNGLNERGIFTGGPYADFEKVGRMQLYLMIREGLNPWSKVVDIGCGCLRGGYWLIHFLDREGYHGIEPNVEMVQTGVNEIVEKDVLLDKKPRFDHNDRFDTSVFAVKFDAFLARSIWSHASKPQIQIMLDDFVRDGSESAFFLTSYLAARWPWQDYKGLEYRGRSHKCNVTDLVRHKFSWIASECAKRSLQVKRLPDEFTNEQEWIKITRLAK